MKSEVEVIESWGKVGSCGAGRAEIGESGFGGDGVRSLFELESREKVTERRTGGHKFTRERRNLYKRTWVRGR
jgi:hypothetical protein